jgi:electron transfer flavoprotein alpha subunit
MTALVIAEHDNASIKPATLNTVTAAAQCGGEVHVLVAGLNAGAAAQAASQIAGVSRVIHVEGVHFEHGLAENMATQVLALAPAYSHILFPATASGKNIAPRVAATLDVGQISDITKVESPDTFERPIYAGNAIATVQSLDAVIVITSGRTTNAFPGFTSVLRFPGHHVCTVDNIRISWMNFTFSKVATTPPNSFVTGKLKPRLSSVI